MLGALLMLQLEYTLATLYGGRALQRSPDALRYAQKAQTYRARMADRASYLNACHFIRA